MRPMLARTMGPKYSSFPCFVQPKLNGVRALYQNGVFQSRDEKLWKPGMLDHLVAELRSVEPLPILDGELYVHGWRLQRINSAIAVNRLEPTPDTPLVEFHVFDIVNCYEHFSKRWMDYYNGLQMAGLPHIKVVPTSFVHAREYVDLHFHLYTKEGYEGIMLRPDGPYEFGEHLSSRTNTLTTFRSKFLWKHKQWQDSEFLCAAVTQGEGKADIGIGALVLTIPPYSLDTTTVTTFKVGTGFTDEERILFMRDPPIGRLVKIRFLELTKDGIPFNPSFLCVM